MDPWITAASIFAALSVLGDDSRKAKPEIFIQRANRRTEWIYRDCARRYRSDM